MHSVGCLESHVTSCGRGMHCASSHFMALRRSRNAPKEHHAAHFPSYLRSSELKLCQSSIFCQRRAERGWCISKTIQMVWCWCCRVLVLAVLLVAGHMHYATAVRTMPGKPPEVVETLFSDAVPGQGFRAIGALPHTPKLQRLWKTLGVRRGAPPAQQEGAAASGEVVVERLCDDPALEFAGGPAWVHGPCADARADTSTGTRLMVPS